MKAVSSLCSFGMLFVFTASAVAQTDRLIFPPDPVEAEKLRQFTDLMSQSRKMVKNGDLGEAVLTLQRAIATAQRMKARSNYPYYALATVYEKQGKPELALQAYSEAVYWEPKINDWYAPGTQLTDIAMDYAMLAAKMGKESLAKEMYYWGMRWFNANQQSFVEPIPFRVVFDPDPSMEVWEYSPEMLSLAASVLKVASVTASPFTSSDERETIRKNLPELARRLAPRWLFLEFYERFRTAGEKTFEVYKLEIAAAAKTDLERSWILSASRENRIDKTGWELRKKSPVVQKRNPDILGK